MSCCFLSAFGPPGALALEENVLVPILFFVTAVEEVSGFDLLVDTRRSCVSAFSCSHRSKSSREGLNNFFVTVCCDQYSRKLGGNLVNAWFRSAVPCKSASKPKDLNTPTILDMVVEKLIMCSELCIFTGGNVFSLS